MAVRTRHPPGRPLQRMGVLQLRSRFPGRQKSRRYGPETPAGRDDVETGGTGLANQRRTVNRYPPGPRSAFMWANHDQGDPPTRTYTSRAQAAEQLRAAGRSRTLSAVDRAANSSSAPM